MIRNLSRVLKINELTPVVLTRDEKNLIEHINHIFDNLIKHIIYSDTVYYLNDIKNPNDICIFRYYHYSNLLMVNAFILNDYDITTKREFDIISYFVKKHLGYYINNIKYLSDSTKFNVIEKNIFTRG